MYVAVPAEGSATPDYVGSRIRKDEMRKMSWTFSTRWHVFA